MREDCTGENVANLMDAKIKPAKDTGIISIDEMLNSDVEQKEIEDRFRPRRVFFTPICQKIASRNTSACRAADHR